MKAKPIVYNDYTEEQLLKMPIEKATKGLNEQQQRFCEYYVNGYNRKMAMIKAGYTDSPGMYVSRLLQSDKVKLYVQWLKARVVNNMLISAIDILDEWIRIAFADMTDFVDILPHSIKLKPSNMVDGQLIKSIKSGRDGVSIELHDKMKALDNLAKYVDDMPHEWKQRIEERRIELQEEEFELKKKIVELDNPEKEDDGFMQAIKKSAKIVWKNEGE